MLCIPVIAQDTEGAINKISEAEKHADVCEIRLDFMKAFNLPDIIKAATRPVIVTYRSKKEGGEGLHNPSRISEYLISAAEENAEYIDVELSMPPAFRNNIIQSKRTSNIIISTHLMYTPSGEVLKNILDKSVRAGGDIVKIVTMADRMDDNLKILELVSAARKEKTDIIAFCMGPLGRMSRIFSLLMGGYLSFTSLEAGEESAPGQIPVNEMKQLLEYFSV